MITHLIQWYRGWESRRQRTMAGWSVRRRWLVLVVVPLLVLCCCGGVVGVPLAWLAHATVAASRGGTSPDVAANTYLMALSDGDEAGLLPMLDDEHQDELATGWHAYLATMQHTDPPPSRLDFGALTVSTAVSGRATVTVDVAATWWGSGMAGGYRSQALPWRFETRDDGGWRITAVTPPVWCGGYVLASKCRTQ